MPDLIYMGVPRSPHWPAARKLHLRTSPTCTGCGTKHDLEVHHDKPYHLYPELELEQSNMVTVCRWCHFVLCHDNNWSNYVVDCKSVVSTHLTSVSSHRPKAISVVRGSWMHPRNWFRSYRGPA
jgi:5-methylcytosine-specific restriction protein A